MIWSEVEGNSMKNYFKIDILEIAKQTTIDTDFTEP